MKKMLITLAIVTILQIIFVSQGIVALLFTLLGRLLFVAKVFGTKSKYAAVLGMEITGVLLPPLWMFLMRMNNFDWVSWLIYLLLSLVIIFMLTYDELNYVYIEEDVKE